MCGFVAVINSSKNSDNLVLSFNKLRKLNYHRGLMRLKFYIKISILYSLEDWK